MNMRKTLIVGIMVAGLALAGLQQASARGWGGGHGCDFNQGYHYQQLDEATKAKVDAFRAETTDLRRQIVMKKAEKRALMNSSSPDAAAVAKAAGELFDLKNMMAEKAQAAGVPAMMGQGMKGKHGGKGYGQALPPCMDQQGGNRS